MCPDIPMVILANFRRSWKSADWKSYSNRTIQRSPKLRTTSWPAKLYFPTSICRQFPANRFGGLSGILSTHTWTRTECPWYRTNAWGDGGGGRGRGGASVHSWVKKVARRTERVREWKRIAKCEKLKRVEKGGLSWLFVIAVRKRIG